MKNSFDKWGIGLSSVCLVHCLLMGIIPIFLPSMHFIFEDLFFHALMGILVLFFSIIAMGPTYIKFGFSKAHILAVLGLLSLLTGFILEISAHSLLSHKFSIAGSITMTLAHFFNWKNTFKKSH